MPELPEVETVRLQLKRKIIGKTISSIEVFHDKTVGFDASIEERLSGKTISTIARIGKLLIFTFTREPDTFLLAHLKMTGQFFYVDTNGVLGGGHSYSVKDFELPHKHTRLAIHFNDNSTLYFNDMRLFGYVKLATQAELEQAKAGFGPEPIAKDFDCDWFTKTLQKRKTSVKAALLDQKFIAGLGNIYVDEALWRAKIRPTRQATDVSKAEAARLCHAAGDVMKEAIKVGGTTFQHFVDTDGGDGNFSAQLRVFGRQGASCERCGKIIVKIRCAGRGTHYCPSCQR